jgi:hypothetical protein
MKTGLADKVTRTTCPLTEAIVIVLTKVNERNMTLLAEAIATAFTDAIITSQIVPLARGMFFPSKIALIGARTLPTDVKTHLQRLFFARLVTLRYTGVISI